MARKRQARDVQDAEVLSEVEEVLRFQGLQGARTVIEKLEDDEGGRKRLRIRAVFGEGKKDCIYEVLVEASGLMGIYRTG